MDDQNQEHVGAEKQAAIETLMDRLASRGIAPRVRDAVSYGRILDWLYLIGFIWYAGEKRFIYRFLDGTPNPLGAADESNKWDFSK